MAELVLKRYFEADIGLVFEYISQPVRLLEWWGPEGMTVPVHALDFSHPGPWSSEFHGPDGRRLKVSGEVTRVDPPRAVGFTWGWHDPEDKRGPESRVEIELAVRDGGTELILTHSGLADDDVAAAHRRGWTSSLGKLERVLS